MQNNTLNCKYSYSRKIFTWHRLRHRLRHRLSHRLRHSLRIGHRIRRLGLHWVRLSWVRLSRWISWLSIWIRRITCCYWIWCCISTLIGTLLCSTINRFMCLPRYDNRCCLNKIILKLF